MLERLVLLSTSHRVAAGLLTADAWQLLAEGQVVTEHEDHPLLSVLAERGRPGEVLPPVPPAARVRDLLARDGTVVWLLSDTGDPALVQALAPALAQAAEAGPVPEVEVLPGSYDVPGARMLDLVAVMDRLRSPGGCPWDAEQTHASLAPYLLEETYETLEAIETDDRDSLREELGDLLLQVVFHARLGEEDPDRPWSVDDVAAGVVEKLIGRHPHVFAGGEAPTAEHVEANWEQIKNAEKRRTSAVDGVPMALPALALSDKLLGRAASAGLELDVEEPDLPADLSAEMLGAILLGVVAAARRHGLDAEGALREAARGFAGRIRQAERGA